MTISKISKVLIGLLIINFVVVSVLIAIVLPKVNNQTKQQPNPLDIVPTILPTITPTINVNKSDQIVKYYDNISEKQYQLAFELLSKDKITYEEFINNYNWTNVFEIISLDQQIKLSSDSTQKEQGIFKAKIRIDNAIYIETLDLVDYLNVEGLNSYFSVIDRTESVEESKKLVGDNVDKVRQSILENYYSLLREKKLDEAYQISAKNKSFEAFKSNYENVSIVHLLSIAKVSDNIHSASVLIDNNLFEALFKFDENNIIIWSEGKLIEENSNNVCYDCGDKPVIYLYPQQKQQVNVQLLFKGTLLTTFPKYDEEINGWNVTANPDGTLVNNKDGKEYSYIFWDGKLPANTTFNLEEGFVVPGSDTAKFLQDILPKIGLNPKEYNEFIVYWLPRMENNKYNLIHFASKEYLEIAELNIDPKPDSILRVFMVFKPVEEKFEIKPQTFETFHRNGFTVVEWGGSEIKRD